MTDSGFAAADRATHWSALSEEVYDLVVIGGGITGCGVARDAAGRGLSVALVESGDIAEGTSSRSSRLAHGGLRYLETFEFSLVFEALRERGRLLELAPHLVRPLSFLFPVYKGGDTGILKLAAGMWFYDILSLFRSPARHRMLSRRGALKQEPRLQSEGLVGGALYYDAQLDDARLTLAVARAAQETGANIVTRARVTGLHARPGDIASVEVQDQIGGEVAHLKARLVLNATGPWCDQLRLLSDPTLKPRLRTTKGVHVVVDRKRVDNRNGIILRSSVDGRVMFVLPWRDYAYIGTTDTEYDGDPADVAPEPGDIEYLLASANSLFPEARLTPSHVLSAWAGVRPLLAPDAEGLSESETSREHSIWRDSSGLLNVAGGKLTTFRSMAAETVDAAAAILKREFDVTAGEFYTEFLPLPGAPEADEETDIARFEAMLDDSGLPRDLVRPMWRRYGSDLGQVLGIVRNDPETGQVLLEGRPYIRAEVIWAVRRELALTLEDVLRRRLQIFYDEEDGGIAISERVARWMAAEAGIDWTEEDITSQVHAYAEEVAGTRPAQA